MSRTINSFKNLSVGIVGQGLQIIIQFIARTVFIHYFSEEYLGINGLFSNILQLLSLSELGFGTAMIYSLYKPIAEKNETQILKLMNLYRIVYRIVAVFVLMTGLILLPFLPHLVTSKIDIQELQGYYVLYLLNTVLSYTLIYKKSIIDANQKNYITISYQKLFVIIQNVLQIIFLIIIRSYYIYLIIQLVCTVCSNLLISIKANKMYPYINSKIKDFPDKKDIKEILSNTFAMSMHKIGAVIVDSTDNLLTSSFVDLATVGLYSNYILILSAVKTFTSIAFSSFVAGIGNLGAQGDKKDLFRVFATLNFVGFWVYSFCTVALYVLFNPFITIWLGERFLFENYIVVLICVNFYLYGIRQIPLKFRDALGLFWYDRYKAILEAFVNLVTSVYLSLKFGFAGILLGTTISTVIADLFIEPYVLYKYGFDKKFRDYIARIFGYSAIFLIGFGITCTISMLCDNTFYGFIGKCIIVTLSYNAFIILIFHRTRDFKNLLIHIKSILGR